MYQSAESVYDQNGIGNLFEFKDKLFILLLWKRREIDDKGDELRAVEQKKIDDNEHEKEIDQKCKDI